MGEKEWLRLRRQLWRARGFWLGVVFTPSAWISDELWARTRQQLRLRGLLSTSLQAREPDSLEGAYQWLESQTSTGPGCRWIAGVTSPEAAWMRAWAELLVLLNRNRERLIRLHPGGLVLAMSEAYKDRFREAAPDLWSIRSLVLSCPELARADDPTPSVWRRLTDVAVAELEERRDCIIAAPPGAGASTLHWQLCTALQGRGAVCASLHLDVLLTYDEEAIWLEAARQCLSLQWGAPSSVQSASVAGRVLFLDPAEAALASASARGALPILLKEARAEGATVCWLGAALPGALSALSETPDAALWLGDLEEREVPWNAWSEGAAPTPAQRTEILRWSAGQPALTRALGRAVKQGEADRDALAAVRSALETILSSGSPWSWFAADRLRPATRSEDANALRLYLRILAGERITLYNTDPAAQELWSSGLIARAEEPGTAFLRPRNRLSQEVFSCEWAEFQLARAATAPMVPLEGDYGGALLHLVWTTEVGATRLLLGVLELLPHALTGLATAVDGHLSLPITSGTLSVDHLAMPPGDALRWYRACAAGQVGLPPGLGQAQAGPLLIDPLTEAPPWPALGCTYDEDYPFRAAWHGTPRVHILRPAGLNTARGWWHAQPRQVQQWLDDHLHCQLSAHKDWLGTIHLVAPNPIFRRLDSRLEAGDRADSVHFRIWRYPQRLPEQLTLLVCEGTMLRPRVHHLPLRNSEVHLPLDHRILSQEEIVLDGQRGALAHVGPGAFLRRVSVGLGPGRESLDVRLLTEPDDEEVEA